MAFDSYGFEYFGLVLYFRLCILLVSLSLSLIVSSSEREKERERDREKDTVRISPKHLFVPYTAAM